MLSFHFKMARSKFVFLQLSCKVNPSNFHVAPFPQQMNLMLCHTSMLIHPRPISTRPMLHTAICPSISLPIILQLLRTSSLVITLICEIFSVTRSHCRLAPALRSPAQSYTTSTVSMSKQHQWILVGVWLCLRTRTCSTGRT